MKNFHIYRMVLWFFVISACGGNTSGDQQPSPIYRYPFLHDSPLPRLKTVKSAKILQSPAIPQAYNPGMEKFDGKIYFSIRSELNHGNVLNYGRRTEHILTTLNANYDIDGDFHILNGDFPGLDSNLEDARLFVFQDRLWAVGTGPAYGTAFRQMYTSPIAFAEDGTPSVEGWVHLKYQDPPTQIEKNWSPFVHNDELYFIYAIKNHTILRADTETGEVTQVAETDGFNWDYGSPRGGSQTIRYKDNFLHVFHSAKDYRFLNGEKKRIYVIGAYLFEAQEPFRILKYTPHPIIGDNFYGQNNPRHFVFVTGAIIDGDELVLSAGVNDDQLMIIHVDLEETIAQMVDL